MATETQKHCLVLASRVKDCGTPPMGPGLFYEVQPCVGCRRPVWMSIKTAQGIVATGREVHPCCFCCWPTRAIALPTNTPGLIGIARWIAERN